MKLIGIDSGLKGCIAELDLTEKTCRYMSIPYREDKIIDMYKVKYAFNFAAAHYVAIEEVRGMKIWGSNNNFSFGKYFGMALMMIESVPYEMVLPQQWQGYCHNRKEVGETKEAKARTAAAFRRFNPNFDETEHTADGLKDAFFVAYYVGAKNHIVMPKEFVFIRV
jgi:hypothetical protein